MSNSEEIMQILKMVEENKITSEEAKELIDAVENKEENEKIENKNGSAKWFRVKVFNQNGKQKANIKLPLSLLNLGLKLATKYAPDMEKEDLEGIDIDEIMTSIKNGVEGDIIDVEDQESGNTVKIYVE